VDHDGREKCVHAFRTLSRAYVLDIRAEQSDTNSVTPSRCIRLVVILERVEDLDPGTAEILVVTSRNGEIVSPRDRCNIAVLTGHEPPSLLQLMLLFGPHVRY
jgi:hypothetical protein